MTEQLPALSAALLTGLLGSVHCLGMCAGISGLFAVSADVASLRSPLPRAVTYNSGRVASYVLLGALVAGFGHRIVAAVPGIAVPVRLISGAIIVLIGVQVALGWRLLNPVERMGSVLWSGLAPIATRLVPATTLRRAFGLGLVWGWLPCGLVYSVLLIAAASLNPVDGAMIMFAFGVGTMPAMLMTGIGAARVSRLMARTDLRRGAGWLIVILGLLTLVVPLFDMLTGQNPHAVIGTVTPR